MAEKLKKGKEAEAFNIDKALDRLEEINGELSKKDISLDDSIKLYNEGTVLANKCREHLIGVEKELNIVNA